MTPIAVYFSPNGGCTAAIIKAIAVAKISILVQCYSFTSGPITNALIDAQNRGVAVNVLIDHGQGKDKVEQLLAAGVGVRSDCAHSIAHNKVMVIDSSVVITGSFNFTYAAEKDNAENVLVITDRAIAKLYANNYSKHFQHSMPYTPDKKRHRK